MLTNTYQPPKVDKLEVRQRSMKKIISLDVLTSLGVSPTGSTLAAEEIFSERRGWRKDDVLLKASLHMKQKQEERALIQQGFKKKAPLKLRNPLVAAYAMNKA